MIAFAGNPTMPMLAGALIFLNLFAHGFYGAWILDMEGY